MAKPEKKRSPNSSSVLMAKAGKKRRERRQRKEHEPCETTTLSKQSSARGRQRLQTMLQMMQYDRPWADLPSAALLTIFRRTYLEERIRTIPLVCKSWKSISEHPQYWSSMIPDSISPEYAFINQQCPAVLYRMKLDYKNKVEAKLPLSERLVLETDVGVSRLETLIRKSGGGDAITSLYLSPFISHHYHGKPGCYELVTNNDRVLSLITDCCPNLKHISFYDCFPMVRFTDSVDVSEESLIQLITKCKRLELIDFDFIRCIQYCPSFMRKLASCLPHLRGIRLQARDFWGDSCPIAHDIAKYLPMLKLLNLTQTFVNSDELSSILSGCRELQYLNIEGSAMSDISDFRYKPNSKRSIRDRRLVYEASTQIPYFCFNNIRRRPFCSAFTLRGRPATCRPG